MGASSFFSMNDEIYLGTGLSKLLHHTLHRREQAVRTTAEKHGIDDEDVVDLAAEAVEYFTKAEHRSIAALPSMPWLKTLKSTFTQFHASGIAGVALHLYQKVDDVFLGSFEEQWGEHVDGFIEYVTNKTTSTAAEQRQSTPYERFAYGVMKQATKNDVDISDILDNAQFTPVLRSLMIQRHGSLDTYKSHTRTHLHRLEDALFAASRLRHYCDEKTIHIEPTETPRTVLAGIMEQVCLPMAGKVLGAVIRTYALLAQGAIQEEHRYVQQQYLRVITARDAPKE
jgi:uncharacterized protein YqeY